MHVADYYYGVFKKSPSMKRYPSPIGIFSEDCQPHPICLILARGGAFGDDRDSSGEEDFIDQRSEWSNQIVRRFADPEGLMRGAPPSRRGEA